MPVEATNDCEVRIPAIQKAGLTVEDAMITYEKNSCTQMVVTYTMGFTQSLPKGTYIGCVEIAEVLE